MTVRRMGRTCERGTDRDERWNREDAKPLQGREGAWAGAKGPSLEREHHDPLRRALKDAACRVARGRWADTAGMTAREVERRWCDDPMPSAQEDDEWRAAAIVLAGIEPAVTSAMRAASKIALPASSSEVVEDKGKNDPSRKAHFLAGCLFRRG